MARQTDPNSDPEPQRGISLEELADAFAQVMGKAPRVRYVAAEPIEVEGSDEQSPPEQDRAASDVLSDSGEAEPREQSVPSPSPESGRTESAADVDERALAAAEVDNCPISPKTLFEAMLFLGNRDNRPLTAAAAAELMRDVSPDEIPPFVDELNAAYERESCPYHIIGEGDGYRLTLRKEYYPLRNKLYGRIREARLSQAAIDVLALVAYQQPITGEHVAKLRGKPSSHILAQLVRRGLLRLDRPTETPRTPHYSTTDRFMRLFNLESLDDLPRSEEPG
jgi:segregation and condensation protein B